jgi:DNA polymerase III subunit chi
MPEIWFYHLQHQPLERALPAICEKSLERGWRVVIQAKSDERLEALDQLLWSYADDSFLAHGLARDGDGELQPVYLTRGVENPNAARLRLFIEAADVSACLDQQGAASYERLILLFDGRDEDQLADARAQWKLLKERGQPLAYWQQSDAGRWERKQ